MSTVKVRQFSNLFLLLLFLLSIDSTRPRRHFPTVGPRLRNELEETERNALCCAKKMKCCRAAADEPDIEIRAVMVRCPSSNANDGGESAKRNDRVPINPNREESIKKFPGYEEDEPLTETHIKNCNRKIIITMRIDNKGHISKKSQFVIIDHVFDPVTGKSQRLLNPYVIKLRQDHVTQMYGLRFLNYVNSEAKEVVYNKHQSNYTGCNTSRDNPTCGLVTYNDKVIPYSEGFCCSCDSLINIKRQPKSSTPERDVKVSYTDPEFLMEGVNNLADRDTVADNSPPRTKKLYEHYQEDNEPLIVDSEKRAYVTNKAITPMKKLSSKGTTTTTMTTTTWKAPSFAQTQQAIEEIERQEVVQRVINPEVKFKERYESFKADERVLFPYSTEISLEMKRLHQAKHNNATKARDAYDNRRAANADNAKRLYDENDESQGIVKKGVDYNKDNERSGLSNQYKFRVEAEVKDLTDTNGKIMNKLMDGTLRSDEQRARGGSGDKQDREYLYAKRPDAAKNVYPGQYRQRDYDSLQKSLKTDFKLMDDGVSYNLSHLLPEQRQRQRQQQQPLRHGDDQTTTDDENQHEVPPESDQFRVSSRIKEKNKLKQSDEAEDDRDLVVQVPTSEAYQLAKDAARMEGKVFKHVEDADDRKTPYEVTDESTLEAKDDANGVEHKPKHEAEDEWRFVKAEPLRYLRAIDADYADAMLELRAKRSTYLRAASDFVARRKVAKRQISSGGSQIRGGQSCANRYTPPGLNADRYHESTHCLRFSEVWYAVYQLQEPIVEHSMRMQVFEKHEDAYGRTVWRDITQGRTVSLGSLSPTYMDASSTFSVTYNSQYAKPLKSNYASINHKLARLLVPEGIDKSSAKKYPEMRGGPKEYLIVHPDLIAVDGDRCNVAGVGFEAFYKQANRCGVPKGSCLANQPRSLWKHDRKAEKLKRKGCFFLKHYGKLPENPIRKNGSDQLYLSLQYSGSYSSVLDMEIIADSNAALRPSSTAIITEVYVDSTSPTKTVLIVKITNGGLISASFFTKLADCPLDLPPSFNNIESKMVLIAPQHQHVFTLELRGRLTSDLFHCSVEALNANRELVALRRVKIQKSDRCICTWHCLCACIGSTDGLKCKPMSVEQYHAAGFQGALPVATAVVSNRVVDDVLEMLTFVLIFMLMTLLFLGMTKALIGTCCCAPVGMWGLCIILDLPKRMNRYYEPDLRKYVVEYDADDWPVHPVNGRRVRNISRSLEFCANLLFFYTYPVVVVALLCKRLCCPYYTLERVEGESTASTKPASDRSEATSTSGSRRTDTKTSKGSDKDEGVDDGDKPAKRRRTRIAQRASKSSNRTGTDGDEGAAKGKRKKKPSVQQSRTTKSPSGSDRSEVRKRGRSSASTEKTHSSHTASSSKRSGSVKSSKKSTFEDSEEGKH